MNEANKIYKSHVHNDPLWAFDGWTIHIDETGKKNFIPPEKEKVKNNAS